MPEDVIAGDIVSVNVQDVGRREGLVVGTHYDHLGRHIVEIQFEPGDFYQSWAPLVSRVRRTTYYGKAHNPHRVGRTIERHVYW